MLGGILAVIKTGIKIATFVGEIIDQVNREKKAEQAKKAAEGKIIGDAYQKASNQAGHEAKKTK